MKSPSQPIRRTVYALGSRHRIMPTRRPDQMGRHFGLDQYHRQLAPAFPSSGACQITHRLYQKLRIEQHDGIADRRCSGNTPFRCQKRQVANDIPVSQQRGALSAIERIEELGPVKIGLDRASAVPWHLHISATDLKKWEFDIDDISPSEYGGELVPFNSRPIRRGYLLIAKEALASEESFSETAGCWLHKNGRKSQKVYLLISVMRLKTSLTYC